MRLVRSYEWRKDAPTFSIASAIDISCSSDADGQLERAADQANNASVKLGALVAILHGRGLLTDDDVLSLLVGFEKA